MSVPPHNHVTSSHLDSSSMLMRLHAPSPTSSMFHPSPKMFPKTSGNPFDPKNMSFPGLHRPFTSFHAEIDDNNDWYEPPGYIDGVHPTTVSSFNPHLSMNNFQRTSSMFNHGRATPVTASMFNTYQRSKGTSCEIPTPVYPSLMKKTSSNFFAGEYFE